MCVQGKHHVLYDDGDQSYEDLSRKKHLFPDLSADIVNPDAPSDTESDEEAEGTSQSHVCTGMLGCP